MKRLFTPLILGIACCFSAPLLASVATAELRVSVSPPASLSVDYGAPEQGDHFTRIVPADKELLLKVSKPGYDTEYRTVRLAPNATKEETFALTRTAIPVLFRSNVTATVLLDGAVLGETPCYHFFKSPRSYRVEVEAEGYQPQTYTLSLTDGKPQVKTFELKSNSGTLHVTSEPSGAQVLLNGLERGTTPCTIEKLREDAYTLTLKKAHYCEESRTLKLFAGERSEVNLTLKQLPSPFTVKSTPSEAQVFIDGIYRGKTPLTLNDLHSGAHSVRVKKPGFGEGNRSIQLVPGETLEENFALNVILGTLTVQTEPATVAVYHGKDKLFTTSPKAPNDYRSERYSHPLPPGKYTLTLKANGYATTTRDITITANQTATLAVKLEFKPNFKVRTTTGTLIGVWVSNEANGDIRIETQPGMIKRIPAEDILGKGAIVE